MMKLVYETADNFAKHLDVLGVLLARALHAVGPNERFVMYKDANRAMAAVCGKEKVWGY